MCFLPINSLYSSNHKKRKKKKKRILLNSSKKIWVMLGMEPGTSTLDHDVQR